MDNFCFIPDSINNSKVTTSSSLSIETRLPSKEEYESAIDIEYRPFSEWSLPKYQCPKCHEGGMCRNEMKVLTSCPPQYEYKCNKCGHIDYQYA